MLAGLTPPDGMNDMVVKGAVSALIAEGPPSSPAGKNLTSFSPSSMAAINSEERGDTGQGRHVEFVRSADHGGGESGGHDESGAGPNHLVDLLGEQDGSGTDLEIGEVGEDTDRLESGAGSEGDLGDGDAAGKQGFAQGHRLGRVVEDDHRHDGASGQQRRWSSGNSGHRVFTRLGWTESQPNLGRPTGGLLTSRARIRHGGD